MNEEEEEIESYLVEVTMSAFKNSFVTITLPPTTFNYKYMKMGCEEGTWQHFNRYPDDGTSGYDAFPLYFDILSDYAPSTFSTAGKKKCVIGRLFPVVTGPKGYFYRVEDKGREEISKNNSSMTGIKLALTIEDNDTLFQTSTVALGGTNFYSYTYSGVEKLCTPLKILLRFSFY